MMLGKLPGLVLDRAGIALLGAIALLVTGRVTIAEAWQAIDVPTIALLFGLMIASAQFRLGGFYTRVTQSLAEAEVSPSALLAALVAVAGILSAVLANDIVCLAMAPVLIQACARRGLNPLPFLLGLACASNVGSAATLIGNPQNMLIGQTLDLNFARYLLDGGVPALVGLGAVWAVIVWRTKGDWRRTTPVPDAAYQEYNQWQTLKAVVVTSALMAAFLLTNWPHEIVALAAAGTLLLSRRMASRAMLSLVDWNLLVLFMGLFVVNHAMAESGMLDSVLAALREHALDPSQPGVLFALTVVLSNLVSNVPAVMLLLPAATHPLAGPVLALASTLAGNLLIVGSIANIIVVDKAEAMNVRIGWREHARVGVPVTVVTLGISAIWLWLRSLA